MRPCLDCESKGTFQSHSGNINRETGYILFYSNVKKDHSVADLTKMTINADTVGTEYSIKEEEN
jgi:hypothetical protein